MKTLIVSECFLFRISIKPLDQY